MTYSTNRGRLDGAVVIYSRAVANLIVGKMEQQLGPTQANQAILQVLQNERPTSFINVERDLRNGATLKEVLEPTHMGPILFAHWKTILPPNRQTHKGHILRQVGKVVETRNLVSHNLNKPDPMNQDTEKRIYDISATLLNLGLDKDADSVRDLLLGIGAQPASQGVHDDREVISPLLLLGLIPLIIGIAGTFMLDAGTTL